MMTKKILVTSALVGALMGFSPKAKALDNIVKPYQSVRSSGMGGVKITTGLYDENFFGNPARVTANPKYRVTVLDPMIEFNSSAVSTVSDLVGSGDALQKVGDTAGKNNHGRVQFTMPSFYMPAKEDRKWAWALGIIISTQFDVDLRRSYQVDPVGILDVGPALTFGHKFMDDALSVGTTAHLSYRFSAQEGFSFVDLLRGRSISPAQTGGQGAELDFDIGGTYRLPVELADWKFTTGAAIDNLLGGKFSMFKVDLVKAQAGGSLGAPIPQHRALHFGGAAQRATLGPFTDFLGALEFQDIGNNPNGSLFKTVHFGAEVHYGVLAPRFGFNQGYIAAGLGIHLPAINIDVATYGEEMSLNVGGLQDRRFALRFGIDI